ncbi:uncharacterized protein LOC129601850 isoform X1 [Paramacrobiotus metropolitanus]|uniref:uncharacterized protein LOC129601850 isoform X1 n=1 Tax=Paramacrobiotus metropolitanus TaxID=2943436 RepID=UPI00244636C1|nr:uncharacterized protein LOC129601850 isoform X1 [Paramacrobiotus metropolitanus]
MASPVDLARWSTKVSFDTGSPAPPAKRRHRRGRPRKDPRHQQTIALVPSKSDTPDPEDDWVTEMPGEASNIPPPMSRGRSRQDRTVAHLGTSDKCMVRRERRSRADRGKGERRGVSRASGSNIKSKKPRFKGAWEVKELLGEKRFEDDDEDWETELGYQFTKEEKMFMLSASARSGVSIPALCAKFNEATMRYCTETGQCTNQLFKARDGGHSSSDEDFP